MCTLTIIDAVFIVFLLFGAAMGFTRGFIKSAVSFIGTIVVFGLAFYLKNPVSEFLYTNLPFFSFGGALEGVSVLNIIIYELIAFLLVVTILEIILKLIVMLSGVLEKILNMTIVLGFVSKMLGLVFGLVEYFVIAFIVLFIASAITIFNPYIKESCIASKVLTDTPVLKGFVSDQYQSMNEIMNLSDQYKNDKDGYNKQAFEILLKYDVLSASSAEKLVNSGKIKINGAEDIINKYR